MTHVKKSHNILGPAKAGPGRPKGALNKTTAAAKDMLTEAADRLGGVGRIVEWAQEDPANERVFWSVMWTKIIPLQTTVEAGTSLLDLLNKARRTDEE